VNAPDPALRRLYRHAATPARWLAGLREADALIERFEFDLRRAGLDADVALQPLLTPVSLNAALGEARLAGAAPTAAGSSPPDQSDTRHNMRPDMPPGWRRLAPEWSEPVAAASVAPAAGPFDPQSHPRLALLQTLAHVDLPSLQRRYGLLDPATPEIDTTTRPPTRAVPVADAPQHSAADAQHWLRTLARRADVPEAADQPLAVCTGLGRHGGPDQQPRAIELRAPGSSAPSTDTSAARPPAEPLDTSAPALGRLQHLLQRFDPARATAPAASPAATSFPAEPNRQAGAADLADTRHPAAAAAAAAALRTEWRRSTGPNLGTQGSAPIGLNHQPARPDRSTTPAATRSASTGPVWNAPSGGFRGLAALGRAAESGPPPTAPALPADTTPPRPPFGTNADALRDGIDAEQLAELLRQQARRHGIDLTEFEP
jgi:hypothetical protein